MTITTDSTTAPLHPAVPADLAAHTWLDLNDLSARYGGPGRGWGPTAARCRVADPTFPRPFAGSWRLDILMAYEARVMAGELPPPSTAAGKAALGRKDAPANARRDVAAQGPAEIPAARRRRAA